MRNAVLLVAGWLFSVFAGCGPAAEPAPAPPPPPLQVLDFGLYWPPQDPAEPPVGEPILLGNLFLREKETPNKPRVLTVSIDLTRASDEDHREMWNDRLAFRQHDWMSRVRVWDADEKWLWPNVPYLLRVHGKNRVERYGGIDPGKGVDNDFAAVLIRAYDPSGTEESASTRNTPLVSAEWYPVGVERVDGRSIVHSARSDTFTLTAAGGEPRQGRFAVWLIYADFMGSPAPLTWPKKLEWAGGILAYFEIDWSISPGGVFHVKTQQKTPPGDTGFDWQAWIGPSDGDPAARAVARLAVTD